MTENDGTVPARRGPAAVGDSEPADRLRWGRVVVVVAVGLGIAGVACALPLVFGEEFGTWQGILASTLAAGGMNVLLAAALIWIERKLVQHVRVAASESATAAVEEGTRDLRENTAHLAQRLDEIDDQLKQRRDQRQAQRTEMLASLGQGASWESLVSVLREANDLNAVVDREITAPLTEDVDVDAPRITAHLTNWGAAHDGQLPGPGETEPVLVMTVSAGKNSASVIWKEGESPGDMLDALTHELDREGGMNSAVPAVAAAAVFPSLETALAQAIITRTDSSPWFTGCMLERLDDDWVVTDQGLESRTSGLVLSLNDVPSPIAFLTRRPTTEPEPEPGPPEGVDVDPDFWKVAVARTYHHAHTRSHRRRMGPLGYR